MNTLSPFLQRIWKAKALSINELLNSNFAAALIGEHKMGREKVLAILEGDLLKDARIISLSILPLVSEKVRELNFYQQILAETINTPPESSRALYDHFVKLLLAKTATHSQTILVNDAELLMATDWGGIFFSQFGQHLGPKLRLVLAGSFRFKKWAESLRGKQGLWGHVPVQELLTCLSEDELREVFKDEPEWTDQLLLLAGGHPYFLEQLYIEAIRLSLPQAQALQRAQENMIIKFDRIFSVDWEQCEISTRRIVYHLLTLQSANSTTVNLAEKFPAGEVDIACNTLIRMGLMFRREETLHLIKLFEDYYKRYTGMLNLPQDIALSIPQPEVHGLELTFLPEAVLIRREAYTNYEEFNLDTEDLTRVITRTREVITKDPKDSFEKLNFMAQELNLLWGDKEWLKELRHSAEKGLPIRLIVPPAWNEIPFEFLLLNKQTKERIGLLAPITRQLLGEGRAIKRNPLRPPINKERLRILVVAPEVGGELWVADNGRFSKLDREDPNMRKVVLPPYLDLDAEVKGLCDLFAKHKSNIEQVTILTSVENLPFDRLKLDRLKPTAENLEYQLKQSFHILHYLGHGLFTGNSEDAAKSGLFLEDQLVNLAKLENWLGSAPELRFVYLSCCQGTQVGTSLTGHLLGLAHTCIKSGIPAVLSMRWNITVESSSLLSKAFYTTFFAGNSLASSLHQAIKDLHTSGDEAKQIYASAPVLIVH